MFKKGEMLEIIEMWERSEGGREMWGRTERCAGDGRGVRERKYLEGKSGV